jgi:hypothetical protein
MGLKQKDLLQESITMSVEYLVEHKETILKGIKELIEIPKEEMYIFDPNFGICWNLSSILGALGLQAYLGYDIISDYDFALDWPHYSGKNSYPIPRETCGPRWEGQQLEYRISLLEHLYKKIEELEL